MGAHKYVLVVDDEKRLTDFLQDFFTRLGYEMHTAPSGEEAFRAIKEHIPTLALLDMHLPGMDGIQVLQTLKLEHPAVKVIVMTSYDEEYQKRAKEAGADAFFPKPLSLTDLTVKIEELLKTKDSPVTAAQKTAPLDLIPKAKIMFVTVTPYASFLMKSAIHCVGDTPVEEGLTSYSDAGHYEIEEASTRKEAMGKLESFRPDFVLIPADWKQEDPGFLRSRQTTAGELIMEMMHSRHAPREIFLFGGSDGSNQAAQIAGIGGTALQEPSWADFEKQATKINRILWGKCLELGLTARRSS